MWPDADGVETWHPALVSTHQKRKVPIKDEHGHKAPSAEVRVIIDLARRGSKGSRYLLLVDDRLRCRQG